MFYSILAEVKIVKKVESGLNLNGFTDVHAVTNFLKDLEKLCLLYLILCYFRESFGTNLVSAEKDWVVMLFMYSYGIIFLTTIWGENPCNSSDTHIIHR